jgi:hypothetical protein
MTKGMTFNKYRNIKRGEFPLPKWLCDDLPMIGTQPRLNNVYLDHLEKVRDEEEVYECHLYNLGMDDMEKLIKGCRRKGIWMSIRPLSQYNPNNTIAVRFERWAPDDDDDNKDNNQFKEQINQTNS